MVSRSFWFFAFSLILQNQVSVSRAESISPAFALPANDAESFPPTKLRGYGTISAERSLIAGQPQSSALVITCESEDKAKILQAKYLSDLGLLGGINPLPLATARGPLTARQLDDQGVEAATRVGTKVYIFTAADGPALKTLCEATLPVGTTINASDPEVPVPMYLDRWDKYGFRFYYGPFVVPQDANHHDVQGYDPQQDFTFAKQSGDVGLVIWNTPQGATGSDGIMNLNSRQWVFDAARKQGLPLGMNIGIEDHNQPLINRYPDQMAPNAESFLGGWYGAMNWGGEVPAWSSEFADRLALGQLQPLVANLPKRYDNIVNWLEPHEEMQHGVCDLVDDHGPSARANFHEFLKTKYGTLDALARQWSQPGGFKSWEDVPFPELATFLNWNSQALDLTGVWKISYDAPYGPESAKPGLDDSSWDDIPAPGHAIAREIPRKPAIFRRHFTLDAAWHAAHPKVWLYLWDFNDTRADGPKSNVLVFVNGTSIPETDTLKMGEHACALEVSSAVVAGDNVLTLGLPQAMINYRCYLSPQPPAVYPALGPQLNAEWADFSDWVSWSRGQAVRRGAQMIRQSDPDRPITFMSPGAYLSDIKKVAEDYGGIVHDTGGMAGSWGDAWPNMMQSSNLPTDCEPGSGAVDLNDFKRFMGRWSTEATQGVDYFQHIGDIEWKPEVKDYFTKTLPLWHLMGKYHLPQAEVAVLHSDRNERLLGFPWDVARDPNIVFSDGRWWSLINQLLPLYPRAGIVEEDFARGNVDQFRVVVDGNTTIMDPATVDQIAKWVKNGGTFITYQQTGRHTSTQPDSWPISRLTGYAVTGIDKLAPNGDGRPGRRLHLVSGQRVFNPAAPGWVYIQTSAGLSLKKQDPACEDLLQWDDGSIAAGMRHLGKGLVIDLGTNSGAAVPQVLEWLHVRHVEGSTGNQDIVTRHFISNNGLYDIWVLWNSQDKPATVTLTFASGVQPDFCRDVNSGELMHIDHADNLAELKDLQLDNWQTRAFLSPRGQLANAPAEWLNLQRGWWRGTASTGPAIAPYQSKTTVNLTDDWAFKPIDGAITAGTPPPENASLGDPKLDDSAWSRRQIGVFDIPDYPDVHHAMFRKRFTVPADWNHGKTLVSREIDTFGGGVREYIDGQLLPNPGDVDAKLGSTFTPGSTHLLAIELWNANIPAGLSTPIFLTYQPDPLSRQPIQDHWAFAADYLKYDASKPLPFTAPVLGAWRTVVRIDAGQAGHNVVIHTLTDNNHQHSMIFNGHSLLCPGNHDVNVTPWVKFGQDNEIIVVCDNTTMQEASIDFYEKAVFP